MIMELLEELRNLYENQSYEELLKKIESLDPSLKNKPEIIDFYAISLFFTGEHQRALEIMEQLVKEEDNPLYLSHLGFFYYSLGQYSDAFEIFQELIAKDDKNPFYWYNLAATAHRLGLQEQAETALQYAYYLTEQIPDESIKQKISLGVEHAPKIEVKYDVSKKKKSFSPAFEWIQSGILLYRREFYAQALKVFERALSIDPQNVLIHIYLAKSLVMLEEFDKAIQTINKALEQHPHNLLLLELLAYTYERAKRYKDAIETLKRILNTGFRGSILLLNLARNYCFLKQSDHAMNALQELLEKDPKHVEALHLAGVIALNKNDFAKAETFFKNALNVAPDNRNVWLHLGVLQRKKRNYEEAIKIFRQIIEKTDDQRAWFYLAATYGEMGDIERAIESLEVTVKRFPYYAQAWNNLGIYYLQQGKKTEAEHAFQRAAEEGLVSGYSNLILLMIQNKRENDARKMLQTALEKFPHNTKLLKLKNTLQKP